MSEEPAEEERDREPVPKLPRGRGLRLNGPEVFRVLITGAMLVAILVLAKPCGDAVSRFVMGMDGSGKSAPVVKPGTVDIPQLPGSAGDYVELHPGMTDDQVRQAIEQAKAKRHQGSADVGSAATVPVAPGSAASTTP